MITFNPVNGVLLNRWVRSIILTSTVTGSDGSQSDPMPGSTQRLNTVMRERPAPLQAIVLLAEP